MAGRRRLAAVMLDRGGVLRGGSRSGIEVLRNLEAWSVTVFVNGRGPVHDAIADAGLTPEVIDAPISADRRAWIQAPALARFQGGLGRAVLGRFDVVHCDYEALAAVAGVGVAARLPLTAFLRAQFARPRPFLTRQKLRLVSQLFVLTHAQATAMRSYCRRPPVIVRNTLSAAFAARAEALRARDAPAPAGRVALIGSVIPAKRVAEFLETVAPALRHASSITVVGDTPDPVYARRCRAAAARAGVPDIRFTGWRADVADVLAETDVVVIPSLLEGLPRAAVEAQAAGVPVVTAPFPGAGEVVRDGVGGYVAADAAAMAERIDAILGDPALWRRLRSSAPGAVAAHLDGRASASIMERAWDELARERRR
jgi:glycosyltransferase involved in cell wall biosynthesis